MTSAHNFQWTPEAVDLLREMKSKGRSASEIAYVLNGPSRNAVLGKIHRLGLSERQPRRIWAAVTVSRFDRATPNKADRKARTEAKRSNSEIEAMRAEQTAAASKFMPEWANTPLPGTKAVKLMDLETRSCRWSIDTDNGTRYCGCTTERAGLSYCPSHQAVHTGPAARTPDQVRIVASMMTAPGNVNSQP